MSLLVAAGGTGQEVAAAVMRICYLTGIEPPDIAVFDSDLAPMPPDHQAITRAQVLKKLTADMLSLKAISRDCYSSHNPTDMEGEQAKITRVSDIFKKDDAMKPDDQLLLDVLLDSEQQRTTIHDGFHGQPAVGSLAFASALKKGSFKTFLGEVNRRAGEQAGLRVVFAGSIMGGVGTAVIPILTEELSRIAAESGKTDKLKVLGLLQLPWFELIHVPTNPLSHKQDVEAETFDRNSACLLKHYLDVMGRDIDSLVFLGLPDRVLRLSNGGNKQLETRHYVCLTAGVLAVNLLRETATQRWLAPDAHGMSSPSVNNQPPHISLEGKRDGPAVFREPQGELSIRRLVEIGRALTAMSEALEYELQTDSPVSAHHAVVADTIRSLPTQEERDRFKDSLHGFTRLHREILQWLRDSLESRVEGKRADTMEGAFTPSEPWDRFFGTAPAQVLRTIGSGRGSVANIGRSVLRRLRLTAPSAKEDGAISAWQLIEQARKRLTTAQ